MAKSEQVGWNLQWPPIIGRSVTWYSFTNMMHTFASKEGLLFTLQFRPQLVFCTIPLATADGNVLLA